MGSTPNRDALTAEVHAEGMRAYLERGRARAMGLGNRGPIRFGPDGGLHSDVAEAFSRAGFYVFEAVITELELAELRTDHERMLEGAPVAPDSRVDARGRPALGLDFSNPTYSFAEPLSDPIGGTAKAQGRHPVKMLEPRPAPGAPAQIVEYLLGNLQTMDSCLRLYGHPQLLAIAEAILGPDFLPSDEGTVLKDPGLGTSVAWHQDGTTYWDSPDWNELAHGFNFMAQLYRSTPGNGVWALPGSHRQGKLDIEKLAQESGSERLEGAVPMLAGPGDVVMANRQLVHGSFANTSAERRVSPTFGFLARRRVLGARNVNLAGVKQTYDAERVHARSRMIAVAVDARQQRFPDEPRYVYQPLAGEEAQYRWSEATRETLVKDYNLLDFHI